MPNFKYLKKNQIDLFVLQNRPAPIIQTLNIDIYILISLAKKCIYPLYIYIHTHLVKL